MNEAINISLLSFLPCTTKAVRCTNSSTLSGSQKVEFDLQVVRTERSQLVEPHASSLMQVYVFQFGSPTDTSRKSNFLLDSISTPKSQCVVNRLSKLLADTQPPQYIQFTKMYVVPCLLLTQLSLYLATLSTYLCNYTCVRGIVGIKRTLVHDSHHQPTGCKARRQQV